MKLLAISLGIVSGWAFSPDHMKNTVISGIIDKYRDIQGLLMQYRPLYVAIVDSDDGGKIDVMAIQNGCIPLHCKSADIRKFATGRKNGSAKRMLAEYRRLFDSEPVNLAEAEAFFALAKLAMSYKDK